MQLLLTLWLLAATSVHASTSVTKVVDLGYATYQSNLVIDEGVTSFLGVRYAAPPTGSQRWQAPQPPATVPGVQNATTPPHQCWQQFLEGAMGQGLTNPFVTGSTTVRSRSTASVVARDSGEIDQIGLVDEDCLFLDVHVPTAAKSNAQLPVIVYIHGGGYDAGNTTVYPTQDFVVNANHNLIAVGIQYRLGVFGFLAGTEVKTGGALNAGLLDQNFALQWVQEHISKFGGDPTQVTIYGQSAGAGSVLQHIVMNGGTTSPPLFHAAMMNSPFLPLQFNYNDPIPETIFKNVVSHVGCGSSALPLDCLRQANATKLLAADSALGLANFMGTYTFVPVVDGSVIVERPYETLAKGKVNGDALIVSSMSHEGLIFTFPAILTANDFTLVEYISGMFPRMNNTLVKSAASLYNDLGLTDIASLAEAVMSDTIFLCPAYAAVKAFGSNGFKALMAIPPGTHALDLSYDFNTFAIPPTFTDPAFITSWQQAFLATAVHLNPNDLSESTLTPTWPAWSLTEQEMLFNVTENNEPVVAKFSTAASQLLRCTFWETLGAINSQ